MKLSDYVVGFLADHGIEHNFVVTGGAVVHLLDSTDRNPRIQPICVQHEESGAAAADGYARVRGNLGLAMTTSGPGATNLTTSICNAFFDSIPMICITGQVARFRLRPNQRMRQRGFQETDIESVFHSICKYVKLVTDPEMIRYELEKAFFMATEGRPGPVVLDIPDDLQRVEIEPERLRSFEGYSGGTILRDLQLNQAMPEKHGIKDLSNDLSSFQIDPDKPCTIISAMREPRPSAEQIQSLFNLIQESKRPVLVVGAGIHITKTEAAFLRWVNHVKIPVLFTWGGADLLPHDNPLNMGCVGVCGPRAGNFAVQNSDLVIAFGTRLSQMITGGKQNLFAINAKKVMVDIDVEELNKFTQEPFALDLAIHSDLKAFFEECDKVYDQYHLDDYVAWRTLIQTWKKRFPVCTEKDAQKTGLLNPYVFIKALSRFASEGEIIVTDTGANICWMMQGFETKPRQKIFSAWNHTPMGYSLPASIGAALGSKKPVLCLIGDGGLMMSLQELATVRRYNLPIKVFIFDNQGHTTMKQTLEMWLKGNYVAVDEQSGLSFPDYEALARAFRIPYINLKENTQISEDLEKIWKQEGPLVCHLSIDPDHRIVPILKYGSSLEQLEPSLSQEELATIACELKNLNEQVLQV